MMGHPLILNAAVEICRFARDLAVFLAVCFFAAAWTAMELIIRGRRWLEERPHGS